ncbi:MAG: PAS domain S-box protein [Phenylobacterium sp.]|uniref:HWE histidine kinase domain-containing protein n=1 Tax=Phenylobacterium sp. TaxID=1871053 RepID=UPI00120C0D8C|nr:HWE histidine kinase domain-containing protein [Phenylobacterium sp.]TAJ69127.1 MAG: PAS domain S-box protein [Phenylobacterium sp.]
MPNIAVKSPEQKAAEAGVDGFRQDRGPFVVAAERTRMAMVFTDADAPGNPLVFANDAFLKLTGYACEEVLGQPFAFLLSRGDNRMEAQRIEAAFAGESGGHFEMRDRRKDGSLFWAAVVISPVDDPTGHIGTHVSSFVDLTDHKREAEQLRFLLDEMNHRTLNTLATVRAIAVQTLRGVAGDEVVEAFEGRIQALSETHGLLGRHNWDAVTLRDVLERILEPFGQAGRVSLQGSILPLGPKDALTLAMVFHELASNAVRHGSLSVPAGEVAVSWRTEPGKDGERMLLRWQESGGPPAEAPRRQGFGMRLIEGGLARDLDGEVHVAYDRAGLVCRIAMPLPAA